MDRPNKLPWKYAADFMAAGSDKEKQRIALAGCPEIWREQVKVHIRNAREFEKFKANLEQTRNDRST